MASELPDFRLPLIVHGNLFVIIDDGQVSPADYAKIGAIVHRQASAFPGGLGCMVIIPPHARPPREEARSAIKASLDSLAERLRCLCWLVEGTGFGAATVRAALAGLALLVRTPYPTAVHKDFPGALAWLLHHFRSEARAGEILDATTSIERGRHSLRMAEETNARGP